MDTAAREYLKDIKESFLKTKQFGDRTFAQLDEEALYYQSDEHSNSIAILIRHISGNLISRFTDFLTSDGEKPDRNRDSEFETEQENKTALLARWEKGWKVVFDQLEQLSEEDLMKTVYIRQQPHSVIQALNRQLAHHSYHAGQIVQLGKQIKKGDWQTLSIPKGQSEAFNQSMQQS